MNNLQRILVLCLFFFMIDAQDASCAVQVDVSTQSLLEYSKQRDAYFFELQNKEQDLWKECIGIDRYYDGRYTRTTTYVKPFVSRQKLQNLYDTRQKLQNFQKDTQDTISQILKYDQSIDTVDQDGNSILDLVRSRPVYNALRNQGASFQIMPFLSLNKWYILPALIPVTLTGLGLYQAYCSNCIDEHSNDQDDLGRTVLMNYIIEQEIIIKIFTDLGDYHVVKFELEKTRNHIFELIQQGSDIDIKDYNGKTVLDYCQNEYLYECCNFYATRKNEKGVTTNGYLFLAIPTAFVYTVVVLAITYGKTSKNVFDSWYEKRYV